MVIFRHYSLVIKGLVTAIVFFALLVQGWVFSEDLPAKVEKQVQEAITIRQNIQKEVDKWAREKERLKAEFERLEQENKLLLDENAKLEKKVRLRRESIARITRDIEKLEGLKGKISPFLEQTYHRLCSLVEDDMPFLKGERIKRLAVLRRVLDDPSVTIGEKLRKTMEALFIEAQYGNTIEVYQERICLAGKEIEVNVFRLGRVSLFFQTLDRKTTGYYNPAARDWEILDPLYNRAINKAVEIAQKQRPVEILELPIGRIKRDED